jgi:hypothetical protein
VAEDFLRFLLNPAFGWTRFATFFSLASPLAYERPTDYWLSLVACALHGAFSMQAKDSSPLPLRKGLRQG